MTTESNRDIMDLPADKNAEANVLSLMISEPGEVAKIIERIAENSFFYPAHRIIYNTIIALHTRPSMNDRSPIDTSAVWRELKRTDKCADEDTGAEDEYVSWSYLNHVGELAPSIANMAYYMDLVLEHSTDRRLLAMSADIEKIANDPGQSGDKIQRIQQLVQQLDTAQADMGVVGLGDGLIQQARWLNEDSPGRVESGFVTLDHYTGGFYPGDLVIIGARPSMGKTSLALNVAINAALAGTGVLFISLEMTVEQLRHRALCMLAGLSLSEVRHNPKLEDVKKQVLLETADRYEKESPPLFLTNAGHTPQEQTALLKQYRQRHHIGLVVIDYFQLMITDHKQQDIRNMATELSRAVKRTAQAENVPIILASQLSPEQEGRDNVQPKLSDLREFGTVDQDADLIMLLFREGYYRRKDRSYGATEVFEIDIAKHRNGPTGQVKLMFDKEKMMFSDYIGI